MKFEPVWKLVKQAANAWVDDYAPSMGAAIAYYTIFSIAPLLLIAISVAGLVFGKEVASGEVLSQLRNLMGEAGAQAVQSMLEAASHPEKSITATLVGGVLLLIGATTVFGELQDALDRIWRAPARATVGGLWKLVHSRLLSFGMIMGIGFLLIVSLLFSAWLAAFGKWLEPLFGAWEIVANLINFAVSFGMVTLMFALIYKIMPRVPIAWSDVWVGAVVTALLFTVGKTLIGLYIGKSGVASAFGAAGSLAVLLIWVFYSAQIFLLGAEFTWVYAHTFGSRRSEPATAAVVIPQRSQPLDANAAPQPSSRSGQPAPRAGAPIAGTSFGAQVGRHPLRAIGIGMLAGSMVALVLKPRQRR